MVRFRNLIDTRSRFDYIFLTLGTRSAASSRVRIYETVDRLADIGVASKVITALGNRLWPAELIAAMIWFRPHTLVVQKVLPPVAVTRILRHLSASMVFEIDDAVYLGYPGALDGKSRAARRVTVLARTASWCVTTSSLIARDLRSMGGGAVIVFPGPAPGGQLRAPTRAGARDVLWLGSPSTWENIRPHICDIRNALSRQSAQTTRLILVGAPLDAAADFEAEVWSPEIEISALDTAAVGLMPLTRSLWNDRKAAYKVLIYLRAGLVPVVPDVPAAHAVLGSYLEDLCFVVRESSAEAWGCAISAALAYTPDERWLQARVNLFESLSGSAYDSALLSGNGKEDR